MEIDARLCPKPGIHSPWKSKTNFSIFIRRLNHPSIRAHFIHPTQDAYLDFSKIFVTCNCRGDSASRPDKIKGPPLLDSPLRITIRNPPRITDRINSGEMNCLSWPRNKLEVDSPFLQERGQGIGRQLIGFWIWQSQDISGIIFLIFQN